VRWDNAGHPLMKNYPNVLDSRKRDLFPGGEKGQVKITKSRRPLWFDQEVQTKEPEGEGSGWLHY